MELSIIIVNWNSVDYARACIASIYANTADVTFEIIVVDNASPNGDVDLLKNEFPEIVLIKSPENLGFGRANNLGFRRSRGSYVLLLNPDTKIIGPAVNKLLEQIKVLPAAGIVGCKHLNPDLTVQTTSIQKLPTISNQMAACDYLLTRWPSFPLWDIGPLFSQSSGPVKVEMIPGACMMLRREVFEQVGLFGEEYFMYAEDVDLNYKLIKAGFQNYYVPDAAMIHYGGGSSSEVPVNQWATTMKLRAMGQYYTKNYGRTYAEAYRATQALCAAVRLFILMVSVPFTKIVLKKDIRRSTLSKWQAVLRWGLSRESLDLTSGTAD